MDAADLTIWCYRIALGALLLCIAAKGSTAMKRAVVTLAIVYLAQFALAAWLWPSPAWDLAMIPLDLAAAGVIVWQPAGRIQAVIGTSFIPQALIHLGRVINAENSNMDFHFWGLSLIGFVQLALLGGWWLNDYFSGRRRRNSYSDPVASPAYRKGMDP